MADYSEILERVARGVRITPAEALTLYDHAPLAELGRAANAVRERYNGRTVWYNRNIHIEPTNICVFACRFCSYRKPEGDPAAWYMDMEQIEAAAGSHRGEGLTEVHIVGGVHPSHTLETYAEMVRRVKRALPEVTVKAFTAIELGYMIRNAGLSYREGLRILKGAGMEAIPGGGAEIFDERVRAQICPEKGSSAEWLEIHRAAHAEGISTNATMLYGHIETPAHRIDHLCRLRALQDETSGFNAFVPLKYRAAGNPMAATGEVGVTEDLRTLALSRIVLDNFPHIEAYWPMWGRTTTELALAFGADDVDGTIGDTTKIYSMAGAEEQRPSMSVDEVRRMAASAGLTPVERDTFYNPVKKP